LKTQSVSQQNQSFFENVLIKSITRSPRCPRQYFPRSKQIHTKPAHHGERKVSHQLSEATRESFAVSRRVLNGMIRIIDGIIAGAIGHPTAHPGLTEGFSRRPQTQRVFLAMLQALGSSCSTLLRLSDARSPKSRLFQRLPIRCRTIREHLLHQR
jgi:hypothetical protein